MFIGNLYVSAYALTIISLDVFEAEYGDLGSSGVSSVKNLSPYVFKFFLPSATFFTLSLSTSSFASV